MPIHIGKRIKEELYHQGISVSVFAKKINRSRNVVYDIFQRESIDTSLLNKIGLILKTDFFSIYSEQKEYQRDKSQTSMVREERAEYSAITEKLKVAEQQNELLKKEITYLKKIIALLEEKVGQSSRKK